MMPKKFLLGLCAGLSIITGHGMFAQATYTADMHTAVDTTKNMVVTIRNGKGGSTYQVEKLDFIGRIRNHTTRSVEESASRHAINGISTEKLMRLFSSCMNSVQMDSLTGHRIVFYITVSKDGEVLKYQTLFMPAKPKLSVSMCLNIYNAINDAKIFNKWDEPIDWVNVLVPLKFSKRDKVDMSPLDTLLSGVNVHIELSSRSKKAIYEMSMTESNTIRAINGSYDGTLIHPRLIEKVGRKAIYNISVGQIKGIILKYISDEERQMLSSVRIQVTFCVAKNGCLSKMRFELPGDAVLTPVSCAELFNDMNEAHLFSPWEEDVETVTISVPLVVE